MAADDGVAMSDWCLSILNVGEGDTGVTFDKDKPGELERARRVVMDMLKLGYAIVVEIAGRKTKDGKPVYRRATKFDPKRDEYIVRDLPAQKPQRIPATARAVGVARSAGGMSAAADSIEARNNLERFDSHAQERNKLRTLATEIRQWAGIPMMLEDLDLVVEPNYPLASFFHSIKKEKDIDHYDAACKVRNRFYSTHRRCDIQIWNDPNGKIEWGIDPAIHHCAIEVNTLGASRAWGIEQEHNALQLLATLIPHHAFKYYLLTGSFLETSERSGITYVFRKLRPTIALKADGDQMRILAVLCQHPIAYYAGTWGGAMCPTDDVIAHLMLMRGDEHLYWKRSNQHRAHRPEAGL